MILYRMANHIFTLHLIVIFLIVTNDINNICDASLSTEPPINSAQNKADSKSKYAFDSDDISERFAALNQSQHEENLKSKSHSKSESEFDLGDKAAKNFAGLNQSHHEGNSKSDASSKTTESVFNIGGDLARRFQRLKQFQHEVDERNFSENFIRIRQAVGEQTGTVIFLHGVGGTGLGWINSISRVRPGYMKVICPTSKKIFIPGKNNTDTAWYSISKDNETNDMNEDIEGLQNSTNYVHSLIEEEIRRGIKPERIIVGGFSQGGALALHSAFTFPKRLGAIVIFSGWLPMPENFTQYFNPVQRNIPILQCHSMVDGFAPYKVALSSAAKLRNISLSVEFLTYQGVKGEENEEIYDMQKFMNRHIKKIE